MGEHQAELQEPLHTAYIDMHAANGKLHAGYDTNDSPCSNGWGSNPDSMPPVHLSVVSAWVLFCRSTLLRKLSILAACPRDPISSSYT